MNATRSPGPLPAIVTVLERLHRSERHREMCWPTRLKRSTEIAAYCNAADIENMSRAWLQAARFELGMGQEVLEQLDESLAKAREIKDALAEGEIFRQRAEARPYLARALRDYGITLHAGLKVKEGQEKLRRSLQLFEEMQIPQERPKGLEADLSASK